MLISPLIMSPRVKSFVQQWIINTLAVLVAANIVHGIRYDNISGLLTATLLLGLLNSFVRPVLLLLSLPFLLVTLGLFTLFINAVLLYFVGHLKHFHVDSFSAAFWGALIISLISLILNTITGTGNSKISVKRGNQKPPGPPDAGGGPVIDV
jgi:putative membrane protein